MDHDPSQFISFPPEICAQDEDSFANYTFLNRIPYIIRKIIDENEFEPDVVIALERLLDEVLHQTIVPFKEDPSDAGSTWQNCVQPYLGRTWFEVPFFFAEMYLYRQILETIGYFNLKPDQRIDPFFDQKQKGLTRAMAQTQYIGQLCDPGNYTHNALLDRFKTLLLENLWANRADLSQLSGIFNPNAEHFDLEDSCSILINDLSAVIEYAIGLDSNLKRVDLILDNSGMELIADLALADYLLSTHMAETVILHCKQDPVFVSDTTVRDVNVTIEALQTANSAKLNPWATRLSAWSKSGRLEIRDHPFWTLPFYFRDWPQSLLRDFSKSDLLISKGDANYRRLVDDRHWDFTTPISAVVNYLPAPCLALRVLKCEVLVGITAERLQALRTESDWMINGNYALIQFIDRNA